MSFNLFAFCMLLIYMFFLVESRAGTRKGIFFVSVYWTRGMAFYAAIANDLLATISYFWLTFFQPSYPIGRSVILWMGHLAITGALLGKFETEEENHWGCAARPVLLLLGLYWYYLAVGPGVSWVEIIDTIGEILDA